MILLSRRELLTGGVLLGPALLSMGVTTDPGNGGPARRIAELEGRYGGRLGVAILDPGRHQPVAYRGDECFALCSTFKFLAAALVLARVDAGKENLARRIVYAREYLVPYSPITEKHVGEGGLSVGEICEAAMILSDNTAANLMLDSFGGPAALTAYARSLGDNVTRLDRREPQLNEATPGDPRDTTSPLPMAELIRRIVLGTALSVSSRTQLTAWMVANQTGNKRLRAGVPKGWRVADKTGTGAYNARNDIAVIWPPGRAPIIVAAYYVESRASEDDGDAVLADTGRLAACG